MFHAKVKPVDKIRQVYFTSKHDEKFKVGDWETKLLSAEIKQIIWWTFKEQVTLQTNKVVNA